MNPDPKTDLAIAGGAISVALIDLLVRKGVIDRGTGLELLADAQKRCMNLRENGAAKVIGDAYTKMRAG